MKWVVSKAQSLGSVSAGLGDWGGMARVLYSRELKHRTLGVWRRSRQRGPSGVGKGRSWGKGYSLGKLVLLSYHLVFAPRPALNTGSLPSLLCHSVHPPAPCWVGHEHWTGRQAARNNSYSVLGVPGSFSCTKGSIDLVLLSPLWSEEASGPQ